MHATHPSESRLHSDVPGSSVVQVKAASREFVGSIGAESMLVTGPVISIVQRYSEDVGSTFPAASIDLTLKE